MKIEMAESLFYSWLRHVKECQIVQTNWKVSPQWELKDQSTIDSFMKMADTHFHNKFGYDIFKQNVSLSQILQQGECDTLGMAIQDGTIRIHAIDVAFHENGLNYGSREVTVMKVIAKTLRTAMCLWGYLEYDEGEIVFASPKINPAVLNDLEPCFSDVNNLFSTKGLRLKARIIANDDFYNVVMQPILMVSDGIADTSELFMRSFQLLHMFSNSEISKQSSKQTKSHLFTHPNGNEYVDSSSYKELKIGKLARSVLSRILTSGSISPTELMKLQQADYSKSAFDLQFPLLVKQGSQFDHIRYYAQPLNIDGECYYLCSQWYETAANNDRPFLMRWIEEHEKVQR